MDPKDYAEWLQDEHRKVDELVGELRGRIALVPRAGFEQWIADLRERFAHIRAHLQKHMALEEQGGYLANVLERRPTLNEAVRRLQAEHRQLTTIISGIHQSLQGVTAADPLLARDCCKRIDNFLQYLEHHEAAENLIVISVFTNDIGTKD